MGITIGREHLKHTATELKDRDIESTTTKVEYSNLHVLVSLVYTISKSSCCRLVHDTANVQTCNLSSLLCSLTLRVREVCRYGDDSVGNFLSQIVLGCLLHLLQHHCRDFLWSIFTSFDVYTRIATFVNNGERHT